MLERLGKESANVGLKIKVKKTKEMRIATKSPSVYTMKLLKA